jgi:putative tryptophan/tyrosine transport system substrate-binding protein
MKRSIGTFGLVVLTSALCIAVPQSIAQESPKIPRVAYVYLFNVGPSAPWVQPFRERMRELGWQDGTNVRIEEYNAHGNGDKLLSIMKDLADSKVDVILAVCTPETKAAMRATSTIPIVVAATGDAVKSGLVQSYSRPGGNVTGVSGQLLELSAKRMELLKETYPALRNVTALWNPARGDNAAEVEAMKGAAGKLGVTLESQQVRDPQELDVVLNAMVRGPGWGLTDAGDSMLSSEHGVILKFAAFNRMPAIYDDREYVDAGGLMSYGPNLANQHRRAAEYVDKILRGAKPADLPMEQPTKFELVINLKTAKALGLAIPQPLLLRADEVIQ